MVTRKTRNETVADRFARAVRDGRERRELSQAALAALLEVSLDHVSKIERQVYEPSLSMAGRFIDVLNIDANELFRAQPLSRAATRKRLDLEARCLRLLEGMDDKTVEIAAGLLAALPSQVK